MSRSNADVPAAAELTWPEREALRLASRRRQVRRAEPMRRFHISREGAHRCLTALVGHGLLRRIGFGRGARYMPETDQMFPERDADPGHAAS